MNKHYDQRTHTLTDMCKDIYEIISCDGIKDRLTIHTILLIDIFTHLFIYLFILTMDCLLNDTELFF